MVRPTPPLPPPPSQWYVVVGWGARALCVRRGVGEVGEADGGWGGVTKRPGSYASPTHAINTIIT